MKNLELIKKGFNAGYLLEKHDSELSRKILKGLKDKDIPYALGYIAGVKEYSLERTMNHYKSKEMDKDRDLER